MRRVGMALLLWGLLCGLAAGQFGGQMKMASGMKAKYMAIPGLPTCSPLAVQNGDPGTGPSVVLVKTPAGCVIPWHWHTANESLVFLSGRARIEMKNMPATLVGASDYIYLPAKQPHQFTCQAACSFYLSADAKFDIHYIDAAGKEISPEEALKMPGRPAKSGKK